MIVTLKGFSFFQDLYKQMLLANRVVCHLRARRQSGQAVKIDRVLKHRRAGNLMTWCLSCPEPNFNMWAGWEDTPLILRCADIRLALTRRHPELTAACRHLITLQETEDGNFSVIRYWKNSDPHDVAMNDGNGYQTTDKNLHSFLETCRDYDFDVSTPSLEKIPRSCSNRPIRARSKQI